MFRLDSDGFGDKPINVSIKYTYEDKHYSMNNLIYKYIDKYGYYEKRGRAKRLRVEGVILQPKNNKNQIDHGNKE